MTVLDVSGSWDELGRIEFPLFAGMEKRAGVEVGPLLRYGNLGFSWANAALLQDSR